MRVAALLVAVLLAGCTFPWDDANDPFVPPPRPTGDGFQAPKLTFGGVVLDALDERPVTDARVQIHVNQELPCERAGIGWASYDVPVDAEGRFGPYEITTPAGTGWRFFVQVDSPGYGDEMLFIGPKQANATRNMTVVLHPRANVTGMAPPGTVLALERDVGFPTFAVSGADGRFAFENVHVGPRQLVAGTEDPARLEVRAPQTLSIAGDGTGWLLRGVVKRTDGAPVAVDVAAWNGTTLWSATRSNDVGQFALTLPPESVSALRVEARAPTGQYGGGAVLELNGPPAATETILVRALC